jgi:hypothetical protein
MTILDYIAIGFLIASTISVAAKLALHAQWMTRAAAVLTAPNNSSLMSALGQKQTSLYVRVMSALPPKADIRQSDFDVRKVPNAEVRGDIQSLGQPRDWGANVRLQSLSRQSQEWFDQWIGA